MLYLLVLIGLVTLWFLTVLSLTFASFHRLLPLWWEKTVRWTVDVVAIFAPSIIMTVLYIVDDTLAQEWYGPILITACALTLTLFVGNMIFMVRYILKQKRLKHTAP